MCLRFQFCTHQRVCILYFLKKSQIRCILMDSDCPVYTEQKIRRLNSLTEKEYISSFFRHRDDNWILLMSSSNKNTNSSLKTWLTKRRIHKNSRDCRLVMKMAYCSRVLFIILSFRKAGFLCANIPWYACLNKKVEERHPFYGRYTYCIHLTLMFPTRKI
jgi:hypothetical protein